MPIYTFIKNPTGCIVETSFLGVGSYCIVSRAVLFKVDTHDVGLQVHGAIYLPRFFCIDATLLCEFESDKIQINEQVDSKGVGCFRSYSVNQPSTMAHGGFKLNCQTFL